MESTTNHRIYEDIARRTDGDIYIGGNAIIGLKTLTIGQNEYTRGHRRRSVRRVKIIINKGAVSAAPLSVLKFCVEPDLLELS